MIIESITFESRDVPNVRVTADDYTQPLFWRVLAAHVTRMTEHRGTVTVYAHDHA